MRIEMKDVACGYGGTAVVEGFSAEISSGEILCLLGPNGVGKTTLFKCILGLLPLMGGSINIDGRDIRTLSPADYAKIVGYVPQAHTPPFAFRAVEVVLMGRTAHIGLLSSPGKEDTKISLDCMERLGIIHLAERVYTELSGGERQMVLVARALAQNPAFLMMDEPTSNLDFGNQARVLENIRSLAQNGLGIVMTTHHPDHVFQCDARVSLLLADKTYISGDADDVITEENLNKAYGIDVAVLSAQYRSRELKLCQPVMHGGTKQSEPLR